MKELLKRIAVTWLVLGVLWLLQPAIWPGYLEYIGMKTPAGIAFSVGVQLVTVTLISIAIHFATAKRG